MVEWMAFWYACIAYQVRGFRLGVRKEYLLDTPTERYDRTAPTDRIFYPGWLRESDYE